MKMKFFRTHNKIILDKNFSITLTETELAQLTTALDKDGYLSKIIEGMIDYSDKLCKDIIETQIDNDACVEAIRNKQARIAAVQWVIAVFETMKEK